MNNMNYSQLAQSTWEADQDDQPMDPRLLIFRGKPGYDWVAVLPNEAVFYFHTDEDAEIDIFIYNNSL